MALDCGGLHSACTMTTFSACCFKWKLRDFDLVWNMTLCLIVVGSSTMLSFYTFFSFHTFYSSSPASASPHTTIAFPPAFFLWLDGEIHVHSIFHWTRPAKKVPGWGQSPIVFRVFILYCFTHKFWFPCLAHRSLWSAMRGKTLDLFFCGTSIK